MWFRCYSSKKPKISKKEKRIQQSYDELERQYQITPEGPEQNNPVVADPPAHVQEVPVTNG